MSKILITGGTGNLGKSLVSVLEENNVQYTIASRQNRAKKQNVVVMDLLENKGIKEAVSGKEIIFHLATDLKRDTEATQNLLDAIDPDSKVHLIYISVVGTDKVPFAYYRQKLASEEAVKRSGIPYTILRATQFHEFIDQILSTFLKYPIGLLPKRILLQPIETAIVAEKLYRLSLDGASNKTYEIGGAEVHTLEELAKQWLIKKNKKRFVFNLPIWGTLGKTFRNGSMNTQNSKKESSSWREWLKENNRQD
ncbi:SDR family oxidoreductase [Sphingobacterium sp. BIGb0116]|uniref:SDR family oxidoreductase n=1 Tax=Sphingobacterium sp. BIGb0116 TaxID=2940619 RepID=UPI00216A236F|nr:SDR family oxidoreductase [Sphingobacterium sp. BIGb0116]MCS4168495.1 uncharacterized protein YbjT (DUF2867 family) [Sphingobacterium sp. BIGb0116]